MHEASEEGLSNVGWKQEDIRLFAWYLAASDLRRQRHIYNTSALCVLLTCSQRSCTELAATSRVVNV